MAQELKTKNAFLTGGAMGLGKAYMGALLEADARVVFGDINPTAGAATEKEFQDKYGADKVKFVEFDVTNGAKFEEAFQTAVSFLGHVDLMVNNAGIMIESAWEKMIELNYTGVVRGTRLAVEHMRKDKGGKGGRIVNCASEFAIMDAMVVPVYCGTKHAVRAYTSCLAIAPDVKAQDIQYSVLCPGPAATDLIFKIDESRIRFHQAVSQEAMAQIVATPERIVEGFMKLVCQEDMNGAILLTKKEEINFYKMEQVKIGESYPGIPAEPSAPAASS